jgi:hypothetical protein
MFNVHRTSYVSSKEDDCAGNLADSSFHAPTMDAYYQFFAMISTEDMGWSQWRLLEAALGSHVVTPGE